MHSYPQVEKHTCFCSLACKRGCFRTSLLCRMFSREPWKPLFSVFNNLLSETSDLVPNEHESKDTHLKRLRWEIMADMLDNQKWDLPSAHVTAMPTVISDTYGSHKRQRMDSRATGVCFSHARTVHPNNVPARTTGVCFLHASIPSFDTQTFSCLTNLAMMAELQICLQDCALS